MNVLTLFICLPLVLQADATFVQLVHWFQTSVEQNKAYRGVLLPMDEEEVVRLRSNDPHNPLLSQQLNAFQLINYAQFADQNATFEYTKMTLSNETISLTCQVNANNKVIDLTHTGITSTLQYYPEQTWELRESKHSFSTGSWKRLGDLALAITRDQQSYHYDYTTGTMYLRLWRFAHFVDVRLEEV